MAGEDGDDTDIYDVDHEVDGKDRPPEKPEPLFRIFKGSKIAISKSVGIMWQRRVNAAIKANEQVLNVWEEVLRYFNNNQTKSLDTPSGIFRRGDGTENVLFSNLNIMLPAVYGKDPDITCSTTDEDDEGFGDTLESLINTLFRRKATPGINAKPKIKKAVGMGLLTNFGILRLDNTKKDDSREMAIDEMIKITDQLAKVKNPTEAEELYGQLEALEQNLEVLEASGPSLKNVLPQNLIIDPYAEQPDGLDGGWECERIFMNTAGLMARFTESGDEYEGKDKTRVLVYRPTHKANFVVGSSAGSRDDGLGMVLESIDRAATDVVSHTDEERQAYIEMYYTECFLLWDKATRRVMLFHKDDWSWPLWVWDDPLGLSRFFPYYIMGFVMSTGGTVTVGETAYYLDHQDEINEINQQMRRIRRSVFNYFFYNSSATNSDEIEALLNAVRGNNTAIDKHVVGVRVPEGMKMEEMISSIPPPSIKYEELFNKQAVLDSINRITNTSDALRGVQFKTNTNEAAIDTYHEAMRLSVGAKVDVVEDVVADLAVGLAEICIQTMDDVQVANLIGKKKAEGWKQMSVQEFNSTYSLTLVAGSMEKPNSVFKKKEAVQVSQAIGQFAQAAPGATLKIMLRVMEQAFTEVVIKPEDWDAIDAEITATMQKGVSTGEGGNTAGGNLMEMAKQLPEEVKQKIMQMSQQGVDKATIAQFIQEQVQQLQGQGQPPQPQQPGAAQ